jgi:hypothetical protein
MVMARRVVGGAEGRRTAKEEEIKQSKKRTKNTRDELKMVIIACEDSKSSRFYFQAIFNDLIQRHCIAATSLIIAKHKHTNPFGVLQDLFDHEGWQDFEHKWIVIDRDEERTNGGGHSLEDFNNAINHAISKKIEVAYSNPCFEIWYLLHFEYRNTAIDRDDLVNHLEDKYKYTKNQLFSCVFDESLQKDAIENSTRLLQSWIDSQGKVISATDNPSTKVHELIKILNNI